MIEADSSRHNIGVIPTIKTVVRLWKKVSETGIVAAAKPKPRTKFPYKEEIEFLLKATDLSTRKITASLNRANIPISRRTVQRVSKSLNLRSYKRAHCQKLSDTDFDRRFEFAQKMHRHLEIAKDINIEDIIFSDECILGPNLGSNRQNDRIRRVIGDFDPYESLHESARTKSVHVFVAIHSKAGVIGPYFIEDIDDPEDLRKTLTAHRYVTFLRNQFVPDLGRKLTQEQFDRCWFQQDGASSHSAQLSLQFLRQIFGSRVISLKTSFEWPPHSPDCNPLDYWFWSFMKTILIGYEVETLEDFKLCIPLACSSISVDDCKKAIDDFPIRIQALIKAKGAHFEPTLRQFKLERNRSLATWEFCKQIHRCPCIDCAENCLDDAFEGLLVSRPEERMDVDFDIDDLEGESDFE